MREEMKSTQGSFTPPKEWRSGGRAPLCTTLLVGDRPLLNQFCHPLIQRQAFRSGSHRRRMMRLRVKAQHKLAGMPLEWLDTFLLAHLQKHLERRLAFMLQSSNVLCVKIRAAVEPDKLATKHLDVWIVLDHRPLPIDHHHIFHGLTPLLSSHLRMDSTAPLSVSGEGCGLWNTRTSPNNFTPTRDPSRSLTFAPKSVNIASMSCHLMPPDTGRAKINARVFELLRFMLKQYHNVVSVSMLQAVRVEDQSDFGF